MAINDALSHKATHAMPLTS